ncbi:MAG: hypothetical protein Ta2E_00800 [Mycoplasmoidaceae bacterium]|nr:MAG: hypothetical protein Ta2E_00800 [Mycoplasmoidaceae bacterium]
MGRSFFNNNEKIQFSFAITYAYSGFRHIYIIKIDIQRSFTFERPCCLSQWLTMKHLQDNW